MGRKSRSLGILVIVGCLMALSVTAQAEPVRTECEIMGMYSWDTYYPTDVYFDATCSGSWFINTKNDWVYIENIIAPADGTYDITFHLRPEWERDGFRTNMYVKNDTEQGYITDCEWGTDPAEWADYVYTFNLKAGANCLEIGGCANYYWIDYIEWDSSTGLRFEPLAKHRPMKVEAEDAVLSNPSGAAVVADAGASGSEYLSMNGTVPTTATLNFDITEAKYYYIRFVARHPVYPDANMNQCAELKIDGEARRNIYTKIPYNDANWHEGIEIAEWWFETGPHTIDLANTTSTLQYDYIEIDGAGPDAPEGDITLEGEMTVGQTIRLIAPPTTYAGTEYHWMVGGVPLTEKSTISGVAARVLVIDGLSAGDNGNYTVSYNQSEGDVVVSNPFTVTASVPGAEPIVSNPGLGFIVAGGPLTLTAPAGGLSYLWRFNGEDMSDTDTITGTNSRVLVFSPVTVDDEGTYTCVYDTGSGKEILETPPFELDVLSAGSLPVAGIIGLALLAASTAWGGAVAVRRKKH